MNSPKTIFGLHGLVMHVSAQQWQTPFVLLPFTVMFVAHRWLGLSDAMLAAPAPGERHWPLYNVAMFGAFVAGVSGYSIHTVALAPRKWRWGGS